MHRALVRREWQHYRHVPHDVGGGCSFGDEAAVGIDRSDGSAINLDADGLPHPRSYSTNPRVLGYYVRDQKVLTLEEAIRKMTSLPAQILGLRDRGQIREGFAADLVVFDPATVRETNSFERPKSYPAGIPYTIVNGTVVIDGGTHTGARPGRALMGRAFSATTASQ